jgi:signal peptidase II
MSLLNKKFLPLFICLIVLAGDIASKYFTHTYLPVMNPSWLWFPYGGIPVFKDFWGIEFSISHQINRGAAWGALSDYQLPLLYLRIALITSLLLYTLFINKLPNRNIPLALIIAGAVGNVIDYFIYGHVVDMLHFVLWGYDFPVFNFADSAIFIGVSSLMLLSFFESSPTKKSASLKRYGK